MVTPDKPVEARPRILVVDDDSGIRMAIRSMLESQYIITEAESIQESLAIFDREAHDLVTLDIQMPDMDGIQGLSAFRQRSARVPVILISGHRTFELAREALRLGANDYLPKPFTLQELRQTVKSALTKVYPDDDFDSAPTPVDFTVRMPLQELMDDRFVSPRHRTHFLAFSQNALSEKQRVFETISVRELIKTVTLQFDALQLVKDLDYKITDSHQSHRIACDMYLLGGAIANLALTFVLETRGHKAPVEIAFEESAQKLKVTYGKAGSQLPPKLLAAFERWHQQPNTTLDPHAAMLVLAEKAVRLHQGQFNVSSTPGMLAEFCVPLHPSSR